MKINNGNVNNKLGFIIIGLFLVNLGFFMNKFIKDTSIKFFNGLIDGLSVGLEIIGIALFAYGIVSVIKENRTK